MSGSKASRAQWGEKPAADRTPNYRWKHFSSPIFLPSTPHTNKPAIMIRSFTGNSIHYSRRWKSLLLATRRRIRWWRSPRFPSPNICATRRAGWF
jgi:hypothetical protein